MNLLEVLCIHEAVLIAVLVKVFHFLLVHHGLLNPVFRAEAVLDHRARAEIAHLHLYEGPQIPRRAMGHLMYGK
jgi:hypothetical protein